MNIHTHTQNFHAKFMSNCILKYTNALIMVVIHPYNDIYIDEIISHFLTGSKPPSRYWQI